MTDEMPATQAALAERYGVEVRSGDELPGDIYAGKWGRGLTSSRKFRWIYLSSNPVAVHMSIRDVNP